MKKTLKKLALIISPLIIWQILELFILPIDFFTFRAWETVLTRQVGSLPGPFYPNQDFTKFSAGDVKPREPVKMIRWVTDQYGYRNFPQPKEPQTYDVVLIGDSNFAGSHIDQKDTLTEVLAQKCQCSVYNHSGGLPQNILSFFNSDRFKTHPPKAIVFEVRRGDVMGKSLPGIQNCHNPDPLLSETSGGLTCRTFDRVDRWIAGLSYPWQITIDRFYKQIFFHFFKSHMGLATSPLPVHPAKAAAKVDYDDLIAHSFKQIAAYNQEASKRGTRFIFLFFPYFLHRELDRLPFFTEEAGIETIGFLPDATHKDGVEDFAKWVHKEDSHWLESSIVQTAELITAQLNSPPLKKSKSIKKTASVR